MSRTDYNAIKLIIDDIVGDTTQGIVLLKALKGYFDQKETIQVIKQEVEISQPSFSMKTVLHKDRPLSTEAQAAMERYTAKLNKDNEKFRKANEKLACKINS